MSKDSRNMEETLQSCFLAGFAYPWSYLICIHIYIYIYDSLEIMNQTMDIDVTPDFEINFMLLPSSLV